MAKLNAQAKKEKKKKKSNFNDYKLKMDEAMKNAELIIQRRKRKGFIYIRTK